MIADYDLGPYPTAIVCRCGHVLYRWPRRAGSLRHRNGFACPHRIRIEAERLPTVGNWEK